VAPENIKLNPEEVLGQVSKIAATMAEVSVPGPVPPPALGTSPIDAALNAVALAAAEKAGESSTALSTRGTEHSATSVNAVNTLQTREESNTAEITEIQTQVAQQSSLREL
jgi:hypothetical protein